MDHLTSGSKSMDHLTSVSSKSMDLCLNEKKPCSVTVWDVRSSSGNMLVDRLSILPDELLLQILSLLPTKDALVMSLVSRRMKFVFPMIASLDFDDFPTSYCLKHPNGVDRFPAFVSFVIKSIQTYKSEKLSRFTLRIGRDFATRSFSGCAPNGLCDRLCFPDLKFPLIKELICFPLSRHGLRELDLRIQVRLPGNDQLPSAIFTCDTLEVLKLDVNLGLRDVFTMPSFHLSKLKLFHFTTSLISEKDFLTKLVSSCPLLEDLAVQAWWEDFPFTTISSPSLRRLCLKLHQRLKEQSKNSLHINTPRLESLEYYGNLAVHYNVQNMKFLVKADINIEYTLEDQEVEDPFRRTLSLIRPLSIAQHLSLVGLCVQNLDFVEVKHQLPMFYKLKYLELGYGQLTFWDKVLLAFLNCSPVLETLVFPQGIIEENRKDMEVSERLELEQGFCRTTQVIPSCCRSHLKRIVIKKYMVKEREINLIHFLLRHALVLEELVIYVYRFPWRTWPPVEDQIMSLKRSLHQLPRASVTCSIQVQ